MAILLAEDLLLLLLDDDRGDLAVRDGAGPPAPAVLAAELVLGGAVLVELDLAGAVALSGGPAPHVLGTGRAVESGGPGDDPLLRSALQRVQEAPRSPEDLVVRLGDGLTGALAVRLAERGFVQAASDGGVAAVRWPAADREREAAVRRRLLDVLVGGAAPDRRTCGLVALLAGVDLLELVVPAGALPAPELQRRAALLAQGCWPATAMQRAALHLVPDPAVPAVPAQPSAAREVALGVAGAAAGLAVSVVAGLAVGLVAGATQGLIERRES